MSSLAMARITEALRDDAPLYRCIFIAVYRTTLIDTPTYRTVIDHDIRLVHSSQAITFMICYIFISQTETQKTEDYIIGLDCKRITCHTDTVTGSRLSCHGHIAL